VLRLLTELFRLRRDSVKSLSLTLVEYLPLANDSIDQSRIAYIKFVLFWARKCSLNSLTVKLVLDYIVEYFEKEEDEMVICR